MGGGWPEAEIRSPGQRAGSLDGKRWRSKPGVSVCVTPGQARLSAAVLSLFSGVSSLGREAVHRCQWTDTPALFPICMPFPDAYFLPPGLCVHV